MPAHYANHKNKNDFYRMLLNQDSDSIETKKQNNNLLIPRSILKRNNPGGLVKDKRLEEATEQYLIY